MKCPNCGALISANGICSRCGWNQKALKLCRLESERLYNRGLNQAKGGRLSQSCSSLEASLRFDKMNMKSRNLLGLVYYERGLVADALKHWIVSSSLFKDKNPAAQYIDQLQKSPRKLEKMGDSCAMFNQALKYLSMGSDDLAVIQLKKAIDFNPKFAEAYCLLALCQLKQNDRAEAGQNVHRALDLDKENPRAMSILKELRPSELKRVRRESQLRNSDKTDISDYKDKEEEQSLQYGHVSKDTSVKKRGVIGRNEIISFLSGVLITAAVLLILIVPGIDESKDNRITELENQISQLQKESGQGQQVDTASYEKLKSENASLLAEKESLEKEKAIREKTEVILNASALLSDGDSVGATKATLDLDTADLPDEDLARYNTIRETAWPKAAEELYHQGKSDFLNNRYTEAKSNLEIVLKIATDTEFVDDTLYYLGKIAESQDDLEQAREYYEKVRDQYPNSNQIKNVENILSNMDQ